jgi:serine/threonine protein kinase
MNLEIRVENAPLKVGDEFLKYEIRALLGHGDHAYVYEAFDPMLERLVAIKLIPDPPNSRRDLAQRSLEQGPLLRDLSHPNLVSVYDIGTIGDDLVYIVMERLTGNSLRDLLTERHTLPLADVLSVGIQVAEGMAWAHAMQVIHRDLKPENIFVTDNAGIKVINAGITSFIVPSGMTTEWDCVRGTLLYMSPEHLQGFGVTARSDIFSLGTLLYECFVGKPPALIGPEGATLDDIAWRQICQMPALLSDVLPEVPEIAARLIQQMLAKEAVLRFDTMDTVAVSLREVYRRLVTEVSPKLEEPTPYVVFPSSAIGMKSAAPREERASAESVIAGAERLVNAVNPGTAIAAGERTTRTDEDGTRGAARAPGHWYVVALLLALIAIGAWLMLRSRFSHSETPADSADLANASESAAVVPKRLTARKSTDSLAVPATTSAFPGAASRPTEPAARPNGTENQTKSGDYEENRVGGNASASPPPAPVLKGEARPGAPRVPASAPPPNELVF